jgi:hypothetical protein
VLFGRRGPFFNEVSCLELDECISHEIASIDVLPFLVWVLLLVSEEVKELDVICSLVSLKEVYLEVSPLADKLLIWAFT